MNVSIPNKMTNLTNLKNLTNQTKGSATVETYDLDFARYIYFYGLAVILPVGLLWNLLCFLVFLSAPILRRTTTGHYLIALAVADTIFLLGELLR